VVPNIADTRKLARTASTAAPVDLRRLLGYVGADAGGAAAALRPESAKGEVRARRPASVKALARAHATPLDHGVMPSHVLLSFA